VEGRGALGEPRHEAQKLDAARASLAIRRANFIALDGSTTQDGRSRILESTGRTLG
jgi:hypothetical protein